MVVLVSSALNLKNHLMIVGSKASEMAKQSPTTATLNRHTHDLPHHPNACVSLAQLLPGVALVGASAQTPRVVQRAGAVIEELDGTVKTTALHWDPATTVIPTGTYNLEVVVAAVVG